MAQLGRNLNNVGYKLILLRLSVPPTKRQNFPGDYFLAGTIENTKYAKYRKVYIQIQQQQQRTEYTDYRKADVKWFACFRRGHGGKHAKWRQR